MNCPYCGKEIAEDVFIHVVKTGLQDYFCEKCFGASFAYVKESGDMILEPQFLDNGIDIFEDLITPEMLSKITPQSWFRAPFILWDC